MALLNHDEVMNGTPIRSFDLHNRGGEFLGVVREWIKCKARNGERLTGLDRLMDWCIAHNTTPTTVYFDREDAEDEA